VYSSAATGAHAIIGNPGDPDTFWGRFAASGFEGGLGLPTGEAADDGDGSFHQDFQKGVIYWSATTGAHAILGNPSDPNTFWGCFAASGFEGGLGLPTGEAADDGDGSFHQDFQGGVIDWSAAMGAHATLGDPGFGLQDLNAADWANANIAYGQKQYTLRPTLIVITHGATTNSIAGPNSGRGVWDWQTELASRLQLQLETAGSQTYTMVVDWDSLGPDSSAASQLKGHIADFLSSRSQTWDVVLIGHSRGAILNHDALCQLGQPDHLGTVQEIMLDPTASTTMGDVYPEYKPGNVSRAVVYDDGQPFAPFGVTTALGYTRDGMQVPGTEYQQVNSTTNWWNPSYSHVQMPDWYMQSGKSQSDMSWFIAAKQASAQGDPWASNSTSQYPTEAGLGSSQRELLSLGALPEINSLINMGWSSNDGGNAHGYISVLGVGDADLRVGKDGVWVSAAGSGTLFGRLTGAAVTVGMGPSGFEVSESSIVGVSIVGDSNGLSVSADAGGVIGMTVGTSGGSISVAGIKVVAW
jgi:hypothetical protein